MAPLTLQALQCAIANNELVLHYQPKVSLLSGKVIGAEALVRWSQPNSEIISPQVFMPLAEEAGLLHDLTIHLLDQVVEAAVELRTVRKGLALSINVAPNDLESHIISNRIQHYLDKQIIRPQDLQIEITESAAMDNVAQIFDDVVQLTTMGIHVLMDDFGTGYSSLDRLSQLPFTSLKLDQGVVKRMGTSRQNLNVVKAAISMARELGMGSIAEGIESAADYNFLMANGCEEGQGYFIGKPMSLDSFKAFTAEPHQFNGSHIGSVHQAVLNVLYYRKCIFDVVFSSRIDTAGFLPSVIDPGITESVEVSRLGLWYFGVGQQLVGIAAFDVLDAPIRALHREGSHIINGSASITSTETQSVAVARMDSLVNRVVALLHALESVLLDQASSSH